MESFLLRVWLPDRPGALGAVASRIGAVKGDVVGIEILEVGDGLAVDELVVQLPDATPLDLLVDEVRQVDGVQVEEVRPIGSGAHDPLGDSLAVVSSLVGARSRNELLSTVTEELAALLGASWVAVLDVADEATLAAGDPAPSAGWLSAYVRGADSAVSLGGVEAVAGDVASASAPQVGLAVVAGRDRVVWRARERRQLVSLTQIVALRWAELQD